MLRRHFVGSLAAAGLSPGAAPLPVIDTHIHLFDPTRPQGVPWPERTNAVLYKPSLPDRYRSIATPHGIKGAIVVEASPLVEDNQWVLDIAAHEPIIVGVVGNLEPGKPEFPKLLERFHKDRLFRGIRYGNLWGRDLAADIAHPAFIQDLKRLADAKLSLDSANPNPALIEALVRTTDKVPTLRVIIDHLPQMTITDPVRPHLHELGRRKQVFVKISEVFRRTNGQVPRDLNVYRATLDELLDTFGEDRVLYGSDWPNSDTWRAYADGFQLVHEYFSKRGSGPLAQYFWRNSAKAYGWIKRDPSQP